MSKHPSYWEETLWDDNGLSIWQRQMANVMGVPEEAMRASLSQLFDWSLSPGAALMTDTDMRPPLDKVVSSPDTEAAPSGPSWLMAGMTAQDLAQLLATALKDSLNGARLTVDDRGNGRIQPAYRSMNAAGQTAGLGNGQIPGVYGPDTATGR